MSVLLFDPETPTDPAQWQPATPEPSDIALQLNATTPAEAATLPPLDFVSSSDYGLTREPVGSLLVDTVGDDMAALFGDPRDIEAQMRNAVYLSQEEAVPLSVMVPLLPLYQERYSQELYGESFQSPVRFLEKTQQPVTDKQARYLTLTTSQRVEQKKEEYNIILGQPGYGIEPPELSPDGLSIEARQKQIDELKANKQPETLSPGLGGAYMPGVALQNRTTVENMEARQALHIAKATHWREQLITPQNITSRAIQEVSAQERVVDQTISNRGFQTWARDYHGVNVGNPVERIGGGQGSFLTDPGTRRLAEEYLLTRPGSGEILWDTLARGAKGAIANVGGGASGGLGVAFSAAGFENVGQALTDVADWTQMEARNSTDLRLDGTAPAVVAEGLGELATYALTGSAVAGLSRAAGLGERGIAIATTMATGSLGGADNAYTLYQEAKAAGASEENARLAAGWGFVGGVTTAIPVTQWALRIERGAEVFVPLSRMTLEATEAGLQNTTLQLTNNFAAQQIYDQNRDAMEDVVGSLALGAGAGGIISLLSSVVAHARGKRSARGVENDDSPKSGKNSNDSSSTSGDAPPENTGPASLESKPDSLMWAVMLNGEEVFSTTDKVEAEAYAAKFNKKRGLEESENISTDLDAVGSKEDETHHSHNEGNKAQIENPKEWRSIFQGTATIKRGGVPFEDIFGIDLTDLLLTQIAGAPKHAIVEVYGEGTRSNGGLTFRVNAPEIDSHITTLEIDKEGRIEVHIVMMRTTQGLIKGYGAHSFARVMFAAKKIGAKEISLIAAGQKSVRNEWSGYLVWPRFGFDAPLTTSQIEILPKSLIGAKHISDLMLTAEGRAFWDAEGSITAMTFNLNLDSRSVKIFNQYRDRNDYNYAEND